MRWLYLLLVALAGTALALQAPINAQLARWLEHPVRSSMVSFTVGALSLFVLTLFWGRWPGLNKLQEAPPWVWAGGLLGAFYVTVIILATPRIGATATFALVIAGQLSASILMDHFGVLGLPKHPADWMRLLGVGFLVLGALLIRR
jgi:transporter family-2 protein